MWAHPLHKRGPYCNHPVYYMSINRFFRDFIASFSIYSTFLKKRIVYGEPFFSIFNVTL